MTQRDKDLAFERSIALGAKDADPGEHLGRFLIDIVESITLVPEDNFIIPIEDLAGKAATILEVARHKGFIDWLKTGKLCPARLCISCW